MFQAHHTPTQSLQLISLICAQGCVFGAKISKVLGLFTLRYIMQGQAVAYLSLLFLSQVCDALYSALHHGNASSPYPMGQYPGCGSSASFCQPGALL